VSSRRDQKDKLRQEREQREAAAQAGQRRRQMIGYAVGGGIVLVAVIVGVVVLAGGGSGSSAASGDVLPGGGSYTQPREVSSVAAGAKLANCELSSYKAKSREHLGDISQTVKYASNPPTSGQHYQTPAEDGAYGEDVPDVKEFVHTLEHGRIVIWFDPKLPADERAALKKYYDDDPYQMVLVANQTKMPYDVAVSAWNKDPEPNGTGRLLACKKYNDDIFTAIEIFKDENRSRGPEPVP
jgi:Protein of unknown function (DUF3105)